MPPCSEKRETRLSRRETWPRPPPVGHPSFRRTNAGSPRPRSRDTRGGPGSAGPHCSTARPLAAVRRHRVVRGGVLRAELPAAPRGHEGAREAADAARVCRDEQGALGACAPRRSRSAARPEDGPTVPARASTELRTCRASTPPTCAPAPPRPRLRRSLLGCSPALPRPRARPALAPASALAPAPAPAFFSPYPYHGFTHSAPAAPAAPAARRE